MMDISVAGKNMDVGEALTGHVEAALADIVGKYFERATTAQVVFSKEGRDMCAHISVHPGPRGLLVQGIGQTEDPYAAFETALHHIAKQLRRYKRRLTRHHRWRDEGSVPAQQYVIRNDGDTEDASEDDPPVIIAEMPTEILTLSVSEAVMRMDLANAPVLMFNNAKSGRLNVVYRRDDANIGWIDPQP